MDCYKTQASALLDLWEDIYIQTLKHPFIFTFPFQTLHTSEISTLESSSTQPPSKL
jgi:hypothetical protein